MKSSPIFRRDFSGAIRTWSYELDGSRYRTTCGIHSKTLTTSGWIPCFAKSHDTDEEQAQFEAQAEENKKLARLYHRSIDTVDEPTIFAPMLAATYNHGVKFPVLSQPKLDGIRCIATADGLATRQGNAIVAVPHVASALASFFSQHPEAVLDGELYSHALKHDFNTIASSVRRRITSPDQIGSQSMIEFHVYDCFDANLDWHARMQPFIDWLQAQDRIRGNAIRLVRTVQVEDQAKLDRLFHCYLADGYEGQMIRLTGPYEQKRSSLLLKRKDFQDEEFTIIDIQPGRGHFVDCAKKLVCLTSEGKVFGSNILGDRHFVARLLKERDRHIGKSATIKFCGHTPAGIPRFPVAIKFDSGAEQDFPM